MLVMFGIATCGAVDADFRTAVVVDCCTDMNQELRTYLVENVVLTAAYPFGGWSSVAAQSTPNRKRVD